MTGDEQMRWAGSVPAKQFAAQFKADESSHTMTVESIGNFRFDAHPIGNRIHNSIKLRKCPFPRAPPAPRQMNQAHINLLREGLAPAAVNVDTSTSMGKTKQPERRIFDPGQVLKPKQGGIGARHDRVKSSGLRLS